MRNIAREPRTYELMTILSPDVPEDDLSAAVETISGYVTDAGGTIEDTARDSPWGRRRLAYPIRHEGRDVRDGFYTLFHVNLPPERVDEMERELKLNTQIIRYLVTSYAPQPLDPRAVEDAEAQADDAAAAAYAEAQAAAARLAASNAAARAAEAGASTAAAVTDAPPAADDASDDAPIVVADDPAGTPAAVAQPVTVDPTEASEPTEAPQPATAEVATPTADEPIAVTDTQSITAADTVDDDARTAPTATAPAAAEPDPAPTDDAPEGAPDAATTPSEEA